MKGCLQLSIHSFCMLRLYLYMSAMRMDTSSAVLFARWLDCTLRKATVILDRIVIYKSITRKS